MNPSNKPTKSFRIEFERLTSILSDYLCEDTDITTASHEYAIYHMKKEGIQIPEDLTECNIYYTYLSQYTTALLTATASKMVLIH